MFIINKLFGAVMKKKTCFPFQVTGLTIGFPCTSISSQNEVPKSFTDVTGPTGAGFKSLTDYCDYDEELEWVVSENVRTLTQKRKKFNGECPIEIQNNAMKERGFLPAHALICSSKYGVPQSRSRCYGLYIKMKCFKAAAPDPQRIFTSLGSTPPSKVLDGTLAFTGQTSNRKSRGTKWKEDFKLMLAKHGKVSKDQIQKFLRMVLVFKIIFKSFSEKRKQKIHSPQAEVNKNLAIVKTKALQITEREASILAVALTRLEKLGHHPHRETFVIQVERVSVGGGLELILFGTVKLHPNICVRFVNEIYPKYSRSIGSLAKDQNFERSTFVASDPSLTPCLIPHGKYVVTGTNRWSLLGGQDWFFTQCY